MPLWFQLLYRLLWRFALPFARLRLRWKAQRNAAYAEHRDERLAQALPAGPFDVWIHAVSVGEARGSAPLVNALLAQGQRLLVTCTTPTGRVTAQSLFGDKVQVCYLPFDAPWLIRRFLRAARPRLALLLETELWPGVCDAARHERIPLWLVNARLSERSAARYAKGGALTLAMLDCLTGIATQTAAHAERFRQLGARHVEVTGNLKFDLAVPDDIALRGAAIAAHVAHGRPFWVAGSTREGEESLLLDALVRHPLRQRAVAVIVPRHPERWDEAMNAARERGFRAARRSDAAVAADVEVVIGDSMGEMLAYYTQARAVVMGGTLAGTGGQNLIEPCAVGVPVVLGPSVFNFQQAADEAIAAGAALAVPHAESALDAVQRWFDDDAPRTQAGASALAFVAAHRGATARTMQLLTPCLDAAR